MPTDPSQRRIGLHSLALAAGAELTLTHALTVIMLWPINTLGAVRAGAT